MSQSSVSLAEKSLSLVVSLASSAIETGLADQQFLQEVLTFLEGQLSCALTSIQVSVLFLVSRSGLDLVSGSASELKSDPDPFVT